MTSGKDVKWGGAYLYHAEHGAKLFTEYEEYREALQSGEWEDSPAKLEAREEPPAGQVFDPLTKTQITRMKKDERAQWALEWFGVEYAEGMPSADIIDDLLKRQEELVARQDEGAGDDD